MRSFCTLPGNFDTLADKSWTDMKKSYIKKWYIENLADYIRKMNGEDKDLAAHFKVIKNYGIVLYGAEINDTFADYMVQLIKTMMDKGGNQ